MESVERHSGYFFERIFRFAVYTSERGDSQYHQHCACRQDYSTLILAALLLPALALTCVAIKMPKGNFHAAEYEDPISLLVRLKRYAIAEKINHQL